MTLFIALTIVVLTLYTFGALSVLVLKEWERGNFAYPFILGYLVWTLCAAIYPTVHTGLPFFFASLFFFVYLLFAVAQSISRGWSDALLDTLVCCWTVWAWLTVGLQ